MTPLDRSFLSIRSCAFCYRFTIFTRILLAAAFIPTGMVKLLGQRFTLLETDNPIGAFFEAMYQTGLYWNFLGLIQVVAGILLLLPPLAHIGAALFLPIMVNIFLLTISLHFGGTPIVTGLMLLAVSFLCVWDSHRFRTLFTLSPLEVPVPEPRLDLGEKIGFWIFGLSLMNFFGITRGVIGSEYALVFMVTGFAAGVFTLGRFLWVWWHDLRAPATG